MDSSHRIEYQNGGNGLLLASESSWRLFDLIADFIEQRWDARRVSQLDGTEQRYLDFEIDGEYLTLHLEHFQGITLLPVSNVTDPGAADALMSTVAESIVEGLDVS